MVEIKIANKIKKNKQERGAITLYVLLSCLFFVFILSGVYVQNLNKIQAQERNIKQIQENYAREISQIDKIYEELTEWVVVALNQEAGKET